MKAQVKVGRRNGRSAELVYEPVDDPSVPSGKRRAWCMVLVDGQTTKRVHITDEVDVTRSEAIALFAAAAPWLTGA